ncbi:MULTISPECIES: wax ester/triacylglycerol synthase family O-acyltransferase [Nocardia]|uniref:wax ester/triacylglycerol synthase family O-acyltransferase n=1 Tax=Nocardia TaxID=1817 RepID=UPI000D68DC45|nr:MULTISPECIES: wax ester/triacylglycerol synthase family O-acyltransferase [Nocardia]
MSITRLSLTDGVWLSLESAEMPMHISFLLEFSAPQGQTAQGFVRRWRSRWPAPVQVPAPWNLRPLRRWPAGVLPLARQVEEIDPAAHLRTWQLPHLRGTSELTEFVTSLHTAQLDMSRSPWELHLVTTADTQQFALLLKVHHSLFDGMSVMRLFTRMFTEDPHFRGAPAAFTLGRVALDDDAGTERGRRSDSLRGIAKAIRDMSGGRARRRAGAQRIYSQPSSIFDGPITAARDLRLPTCDLERLKQLARATGCTVNDVVLYLTSTALRTYLTEHATLPDRSLTAGVPTNLREGDDDRVGTRAGMMFTSLATDIADPLERLAAVRRHIRAAKADMAEMAPAAVIGYGLAVTAPWVIGLQFGFRRTPASHPMGISNVPGPSEYLYWDGARLESMYPISLLMHGNTFNLTCISYAGTVHFGILGAADLLPPLTHFVDALHAALDELATLTATTRLAG